jgi:hypothetical protein
MTVPRLVVRSAAALGAVVTFGFMLYAGSPSELQWWSEMPIFGTWCLFPYLVLILLSWRWASSTTAQVLLGVAAVVTTVPVPFVLHDAFVAHHSSTAALVFLFLPLYQFFVVVPLSLAAWWAVRKTQPG